MTDYSGGKNMEKGEPDVEQPKKKIQPLELEGAVKERKKPIGSRIKEVLFGGEFKSAAQYIASDVLLPAFRDLLVSAATTGVERVVYGEDRRVPRSRTPEYRPRMTYNKPVRRHPDDPRMAHLPDQPSRPARRNNNSEVLLTSKVDAELVLESMYDILNEYQVVSVADMHELIGIPSAHIDYKWGWEDLRGTVIRQVHQGFLLDLPSPEPI